MQRVPLPLSFIVIENFLRSESITIRRLNSVSRAGSCGYRREHHFYTILSIVLFLLLIGSNHVLFAYWYIVFWKAYLYSFIK